MSTRTRHCWCRYVYDKIVQKARCDNGEGDKVEEVVREDEQ